MNLQQLDYIVAIDKHRSFAKAAAACHVTQPTLSSMVKKLEEELDVTLFDRTKPPVVPTAMGEEIVEHARAVLREVSLLRRRARGAPPGADELRIGIIPTLAPYLIPLFLPRLLKKHPAMKVSIAEMTTDTITEALSKERLDVGVLATPLEIAGLREQPLFKERFLAYTAKSEGFSRKKYLLPSDIDPERLWLLEEGHCLRSQVMNLCELRRHTQAEGHLHYVSGSIASLMRLVDTQGGVTIVPELATWDMDRAQQKRLREFAPPVPVRMISLVTYRHTIKDAALEALRSEIMAAVKGLGAPPAKRTHVLPIAPAG